MEEANKLKEKIESLEQELQEAKEGMEGFEEERDFYYGKLRDIEVLLQNENIAEDDPGVCGKILKVLYATDENDNPDEGQEYEDEGVIDDDEQEQ